jgi:hypothetical protein
MTRDELRATERPYPADLSATYHWSCANQSTFWVRTANCFFIRIHHPNAAIPRAQGNESRLLVRGLMRAGGTRRTGDPVNWSAWGGAGLQIARCCAACA